MSRFLPTFVVIAIILYAQTSISPSQITCPVSALPMVLLSQPTSTGTNGSPTGARLLCANLQGFTISNSTPPVIVPSGGTVVYVDAEVPGGAIDGTNINFTLAIAPNPPTSLHLKLNGMELYQTPGPTGGIADYSLSGTAVTMISIVPQPGSRLSADSRHF